METLDYLLCSCYKQITVEEYDVTSSEEGNGKRKGSTRPEFLTPAWRCGSWANLNAIYNAARKRVRDLPITPDKLIAD